MSSKYHEDYKADRSNNKANYMVIMSYLIEKQQKYNTKYEVDYLLYGPFLSYPNK